LRAGFTELAVIAQGKVSYRPTSSVALSLLTPQTVTEAVLRLIHIRSVYKGMLSKCTVS